jgi:hypothetical protein
VNAPVSAAALAQAARLQESSMLDSAIIRRSTAVDDGGGGTTETISFLGPYACRVGVGRLQRGEVIVGGQLQGQIPSTITLPVGTDVRESDRINVNGAIAGDDFVGGTTYEVMAIYAPESYQTALSLLCVKR